MTVKAKRSFQAIQSIRFDLLKRGSRFAYRFARRRDVHHRITLANRLINRFIIETMVGILLSPSENPQRCHRFFPGRATHRA